MTLSWPSFLAAFSSAETPPRSWAEVAFAASFPDPPEPPELLLSEGGAHAASATTLSAATVSRKGTRGDLLAMTAPPRASDRHLLRTEQDGTAAVRCARVQPAPRVTDRCGQRSPETTRRSTSSRRF